MPYYIIIWTIVLVLLYLGWRRLQSTKSFTPRQEKEFLRLVERYFANQQRPYRIENGAVHLLGEGRMNAVLGLSNLIQVCRLSRQAKWPAIIQQHFDLLFQSMWEAQTQEADIKNFDKMRELLVPRLIERKDISHTNQLVTREDLPELLTYLALDFPTTVRSVTRDEIAEWGKSEDELFAIALRNVQRICQPKVIANDSEAGKFIGFVSDSFYAHTFVLLLSELPECLGPHGTLVIIPTRGCMSCYPIHDLRVKKAIEVFLGMAHKLAALGPGTITNKLYWYHDGKFTLLPAVLEDNAITFDPPAEFQALLETLDAANESEPTK